jgi:hypothetical protein
MRVYSFQIMLELVLRSAATTALATDTAAWMRICVYSLHDFGYLQSWLLGQILMEGNWMGGDWDTATQHTHKPNKQSTTYAFTELSTKLP